jgi:hypothetical protein
MKLSAFVVLAAALGVHGAFYERFEDIHIKEFDFIIIGGVISSSALHVLSVLTCDQNLSGGVGGNVVANRLSEDPKVKVLVLEAGLSYVLVLCHWFTCNDVSPGIKMS